MGGCLLPTHAPLQVGTFVQVNVLPQADSTSFTVETTLVRPSRPGTVGWDFLDVRSGNMERLGEYVRGLLHSQCPIVETGSGSGCGVMTLRWQVTKLQIL